MKSELKVGIMIFTAAAAFGVMSLRLTQSRSAMGRLETYYCRFPDVTGLAPNSFVKAAGINVGFIKEMRLRENQAELVMEISQSVTIHSDANVALRSMGYIGDKYLLLFPGTESKPVLPPGSLIPIKAETMTFEQLADRSAKLLDRLNELAQILRDALAGPGEASESRLERITRDLEHFSDQLGRAQGLDRMTSDLNIVAANLRDITTRIDQGQGSVGKLIASSETVDRINVTLSSVERAASEAAGLSLSFDANSAWVAADDRSRGNFSLLASLGRESSILLGAAVRPASNLPPLGDTGAAVNAQFLQRFGPAGIRLGLFEGFAGGGLELYGGNWLRAYGEIYRFQSDISPQVNLGTELHFFPPFYAWLGGDFVSSDTYRSFFLGAGLRFPIYGDPRSPRSGGIE